MFQRYVGKKKCAMCGVPVLVCPVCSSARGLVDSLGNAEIVDNDVKINILKPIVAKITKKSRNDSSDSMIQRKGRRKRSKPDLDSVDRETHQLLWMKLTKFRCQLCVKQNCTVPVDEIDVTANGTRTKAFIYDDEGSSFFNEDNFNSQSNEHGMKRKAATTVCKWGGGYSKKGTLKKKRTYSELIDKNTPTSVDQKRLASDSNAIRMSSDTGSDNKLASRAVKPAHQATFHDNGNVRFQRMCKWGKSCHRSDCWFLHDE
jgi:hypothetical protein